MSCHRRPSIGRGTVGRVSTRTIGRISAKMSVEYRPRYGPERRPRSRPIGSVDYRPTLSAECRSIIGRGSAGRVSTRTIGRVSADTIGQVSTGTIGREFVESLYRPRYRYYLLPTIGRVSVECRWSVGRLSAKYRPTLSVECRWSIGRDIDRHLGRYSTNILHPHTQPILDRHLGRHLSERSTDIWSSIGRHALQVGRPSVATIGPCLVGMSVYTRPTRRPLCYDELSAAYRSTVGVILCIVNRLFC